MAGALKVGIAGGGWPGLRHAEGYTAAGGFKVVAVADPIPERRARLVAAASTGNAVPRAVEDVQSLVHDKELDAISICLPTDMHVSVAMAAMKAGKHVVVEPPPGPTLQSARQLARAAARCGKVLMYALQRRYGAAEQAARQAIEKGYVGEPFHARAAWTRLRGVPHGTGWYTDPDKSGGGALIDMGLPFFDLAWSLMGQPQPQTVFTVTQKRFGDIAGETVEESAIAVIKFVNGASLELVCAWATNLPPAQVGTVCRVSGDAGAVEVYTPRGPLVYRGFDNRNATPKETPLKLPKVSGHAALLRHFRECVASGAEPATGSETGLMLMSVIEALYKSATTGRSVDVKPPTPRAAEPLEAEEV
jgi:predicted dehydrogenase